MWMAAHKLAGDGLDHIRKGESPLFLGHSGMEDYLEQEISEFVLQVGQIASFDGVQDLVGFLKGVGSNGGEVLLQIPGAAGDGCPERGHDLQKLRNVGGRLHERLLVAFRPRDSLRTRPEASLVW